MKQYLYVALSVAASIFISSCQHNGAIALHNFTKKNALHGESIATRQHEILILSSKSLFIKDGQSLHIYLEGDGTPWFRGIEPSENPTSNSFIALKMMLQDKHPSLYLNRPCYGFITLPDNCNNALWTSARYSTEVINAMSDALDQIKISTKAKNFTLIGHSGGASIAILLAKERKDIDKVITIAGNLDHKAWTEHFGYDPLSHSQNPIDYLPLDKSIKRWHLFGELDKVIPLSIFEKAAEKDKHAIIKYENFDHICCWLKEWPHIINKIVNDEIQNR